MIIFASSVRTYNGIVEKLGDVFSIGKEIKQQKMLKNSFIHIPGIGAKTERQLWDAGLLDWKHLESNNSYKISPKRYQKLIAFTKESPEQFENKNPNYFSDVLPSKEHWGLFPHFRSHTAYLDIETTGIKMFGFEITTIALYDGNSITRCSSFC